MCKAMRFFSLFFLTVSVVASTMSVVTNASVCDSGTKQIHGYVRMGLEEEKEKNMFFWLVESKSNPRVLCGFFLPKYSNDPKH